MYNLSKNVERSQCQIAVAFELLLNCCIDFCCIYQTHTFMIKSYICFDGCLKQFIGAVPVVSSGFDETISHMLSFSITIMSRMAVITYSCGGGSNYVNGQSL